MQPSLPKITLTGLLTLTSVTTFAEVEPKSKSKGELTGNVAVVNKYIYRGSEENDDASLQIGFEYAHQSGLFIGYWGSNLNYNPAISDKSSGIENDLYMGYQKEVTEDLSFRSQLTAYVYSNAGNVYEDRDKRSTNGYELINTMTYKELTLGASVMLADASYANAGDVYVSAAHSYALPYDFSLNSSVGFSFNNDRRDDAVLTTSKTTTFTEARLGMSKDFADTGLQLTLDYIWGGKTRTGDNFDNYTVFGMNYSF